MVSQNLNVGQRVIGKSSQFFTKAHAMFLFTLVQYTKKENILIRFKNLAFVSLI